MYVRQIKLRRWFPPHDRFAACVARLCILREDFTLEILAINTKRLAKLDRHSSTWRRLYFWRNLIRTISEIRGAIQRLVRVREFKELSKKQSPAWQKRFALMVQRLEDDRALIQETRNALGGHVLETTVECVLNNMDFDDFSYIEIGSKRKSTHYKFAGDLAATMLVAGVPAKQQEAEIQRRVRAISSHLSVSHLIDTIFEMYVDSRKLLD